MNNAGRATRAPLARTDLGCQIFTRLHLISGCSIRKDAERAKGENRQEANHSQILPRHRPINCTKMGKFQGKADPKKYAAGLKNTRPAAFSSRTGTLKFPVQLGLQGLCHQPMTSGSDGTSLRRTRICCTANRCRALHSRRDGEQPSLAISSRRPTKPRLPRNELCSSTLNLSWPLLPFWCGRQRVRGLFRGRFEAIGMVFVHVEVTSPSVAPRTRA